MITASIALIATCVAAVPDAPKYFKIAVVDEQTGRGVPLVELTTTNSIRYWTDSNGLVAFHEPGLMNKRVFFTIKSHGYAFPKDGFGTPGTAVETKEGAAAVLKIKRINIAERLYRVIGQGIYSDSVLLGEKVPLEQPVMNTLVMGSDSVSTVLYGGKIFWLWGDTGWPAYPLGNFSTTCATSLPSNAGGLDPDVGVNLTYFADEKSGFSKKMAPLAEHGPVWLDALVTLPDETGRERLYAAFARVNNSMEAQERGVMVFNDEKQIFEKVAGYPVKAPLMPGGHPFRHGVEGDEHFYFPAPFPHARVKANVKSFLDVSQYEGYTCLKAGSRLDSPQLDRDAQGVLRYGWKRDTPPLGPKEQADLIKAGTLKPDEALVQLQDADTGKAVGPHSGSVYWNEYRNRWITIRCEFMGTSMLGETWYAEADSPEGPWVYARKIVTHDKYSFYNPKQHPLFDRDGGRVIYFEGTYTYTFSGNTDPTPRYDYNQLMYKLDLGDPRLVLPVPVYQGKAGLELRGKDPQFARPGEIAFFALDRAKDGAVAVSADRKSGSLEIANDKAAGTPLFYALPADMKDPPATTVLLFEYMQRGKAAFYTSDRACRDENARRHDRPVCRVWRNPSPKAW